MRRVLAGLAVAALALLAVPGGAQADTPPGVGTFTVAGTGQVKMQGTQAAIDVTIVCPKGTGWFTDQSSIMVFSKIGFEDADAAFLPQSGKCKGKPQKESLMVKAFHATILKGAHSPEYALGLIFDVDGGETTRVARRGGPGHRTGDRPQVRRALVGRNRRVRGGGCGDRARRPGSDQRECHRRRRGCDRRPVPGERHHCQRTSDLDAGGNDVSIEVNDPNGDTVGGDEIFDDTTGVFRIHVTLCGGTDLPGTYQVVAGRRRFRRRLQQVRGVRAGELHLHRQHATAACRRDDEAAGRELLPAQRLSDQQRSRSLLRADLAWQEDHHRE